MADFIVTMGAHGRRGDDGMWPPRAPRARGRRGVLIRVLALALWASTLVVIATPAPAGAAITLTPSSGFSAPLSFPAPLGTSEAFSGAAVASNLLGSGGTQVAVGAMNGCVLIYELTDLARSPACIYTGAGPVQATPLLTDLDADGFIDMVAANAGTGWVLAFRGGPSGLASGAFFAQYTTLYPQKSPGVFSTPVVGDLDGNGQQEIVATSWNHSVFAWRLDGSLVPGFPRFLYDTLWSSPSLRDLDGDNRPEIIFGGDMDNYPGAPYPWGGLLWVLRGDGSDVPGWPRVIPRQVVWSSPAVGDVDANGGQDIVFGTGLYFGDSGHHVYALNQGGYALPGWSSGGEPGVNLGSHVMASPALGNLVNGDPRLYTAVVTGDGFTVVLNPDGSRRWVSCDDWTGTCPHFNAHHGSAAIADVNGDGQQDVVSFPGNKLRIFNGNTGAIQAEDHNIDPCCQIRTFAPAAAPTVSRVGSDTWIVVHALYDANGNGARDSGDRDRVLAWKVSGVPQGRFDWPTFKQNQRRTGTLVDLAAPTASFAPVPPSTSTSTKVDVNWTATDPVAVGEHTSGIRAFDVDARDGSGPWVRWIDGAASANSGNVGTGGASLYGLPGHTYSLRVRARDGAGNASPFSATTTVTFTAGASSAQPFRSAYAVARNGDTAAVASPPVGGPVLPNRARGIAAVPGGGWVVDGFGAVHAFGTAPSVSISGTFQGWDIVRGIAMNPDGSNSGYVLDGFGGLHPVGGAAAGASAGYWSGWDIARGVVLLPSSTKAAPAGYVLDGWGGVHPFGAAPNVSVAGYFYGWDIARGFALDPDGAGGYVLDGWGGLHAFGGAPRANSNIYWYGWDIARGVALIRGAGTAGYVLDGFGGVHPFGGAPSVPSTRYWGADVGRGLAIAP